MAHCSACNAPITWILGKTGSRLPVNPNGSTHWATCPRAASFRNARRERQRDARQLGLDLGREPADLAHAGRRSR